jgi:hypothetical protein
MRSSTLGLLAVATWQTYSDVEGRHIINLLLQVNCL